MMMRLTARAPLPAFLLCLVLLLPVVASAQVNCDTVPTPPAFPLDHVKTFQFGTWAGTDCWGWQGPDGTEYAIMGTKYGVHFINANTLEVVDSVVGPGPCGASWRDMKTYRNYCYVVSECSGTHQGMMIIDMQYLPDSVRFIRTYLGPGMQVTSHNISIDTARGYAYLMKSDATGFRVVSLANPVFPYDVTEIVTEDIHDVFARNDTVWVAEGWESSYSIWDLTDKQSPVMLMRLSLSSTAYAHNIWPTDDSRYFVTTEETAGKTIKTWDAQNMADIQLAGQFLAPSGLAHNVHILGDYAVMSHYESGLQVVDISVPECPSEVARYDTYPSGEVAGYEGTWGAFPFTSNGLMYASNLDGRLFVFTTTQPVAFTNFTGTPRVTTAPAVVQFNDISHTPATGWSWTFGDGGSSTNQNPAHLYSSGGLYAVHLQTTTGSGPGSVQKENFITVLADTIGAVDIANGPGVAIVWDIRATNAVPWTGFVLPVTLTNVPSVMFFDSISFVGTRVDYFESKQVLFDNLAAGQIAVKCVADDGGGSPALAPGSGLIARVYVRTRATASIGAVSQMNVGPLAGYAISATTLTTVFTPVFNAATLTIVETPCECFAHGDVVDDGVLDALDLSVFIDFIFFEGIQPPRDPICPHIDRGDFNCDGIDNTVDLSMFIDAIFFGGPGACDPCACDSYPAGCP